jgi:hypothetical protein
MYCALELRFHLLIIVQSRFLSDVIHRRMLNPTFLPAILRTLRATLFPNNGLGPPRQLPSDDEVKEIKERCAVSILSLLHIGEVLSNLEDSYLNKHLIFQIVELIILRLVPELGMRGVRDLMEERSVEMHTEPPIQSISRSQMRAVL